MYIKQFHDEIIFLNLIIVKYRFTACVACVKLSNDMSHEFVILLKNWKNNRVFYTISKTKNIFRFVESIKLHYAYNKAINSNSKIQQQFINRIVSITQMSNI